MLWDNLFRTQRLPWVHMFFEYFRTFIAFAYQRLMLALSDHPVASLHVQPIDYYMRRWLLTRKAHRPRVSELHLQRLGLLRLFVTKTLGREEDLKFLSSSLIVYTHISLWGESLSSSAQMYSVMLRPTSITSLRHIMNAICEF